MGMPWGKNQCLSDFLGTNCPELLKTTLKKCGDSCMLFDNVTEDEAKITQLRKELLSLVKAVVDNNGGMPYTNDPFDELKKEEVVASSSDISSLDNQFKRFIEIVESRLRECILRLEKQLAEERAAQLEAEAKVQAAQTKSEDEVRELEERLKKAEKLSEDLKEELKNKSHESKGPTCVIL